MSSLDLEEPWGQLVSIESDEEERIPIVGRGITIGRGKGVCGHSTAPILEQGIGLGVVTGTVPIDNKPFHEVYYLCCAVA